MKKILRFGAVIFAASLVLLCAACKDAGGTVEVPSSKLPANVGENPLASDSSATGVVMTVYDRADKENAYYKVEFNADGTATEYYINREYDEETHQYIIKKYEKESELKYSWDAEKKNIYLVHTGIYEDSGDGKGNKLYTSVTAYVDAYVEYWRKDVNEYYEEYKKEAEENGETPLSFNDFVKEETGMTLEECIEETKEEMKEEIGDYFDAVYTLSYKEENGKLVFTGVYTGFANSDFGYLERDSDSSGNIGIYWLGCSKRDENNGVEFWVEYRRDSYDKTTFTYKVDEQDKELAEYLGLPEKIVANYTDDVPNGKLTITFKDPLTNKEISSSFTFEPRHYYEL